MKYIIDEYEVSERTFYTALENETTDVVDNDFDDLIDEFYEPYKMGSLTFNASAILKIDAGAYNMAKANEVSCRLTEVKESLKDGNVEVVNGVTFQIVEEGESEWYDC